MSAAARPSAQPESGRSRQESVASTSGTTGSGSWPQGASHKATMTIGAVLSALKPEFPAVTISKLRFLEEQGLVTPSRTGSGYRSYSQADVERVRYALTAQRDSYLPLRVIREQLAELDAGRSPELAPNARVVARDGELVSPQPHTLVTAREICELTGVSEAELDEMALAGLVQADTRGRFPARAVQVVQVVLQLSRHGIAARHLRTVRTSAEREADVIDQVVAPLRAQRSGAARERSRAQATELGELYANLHTELLRGAIEQLS